MQRVAQGLSCFFITIRTPLFAGVITLLVMVVQTSNLNASLPPVSYTTAIDVWTRACLSFVFGAFLEFVLVNYLSQSDETPKENLTEKYQEAEHDATTDLLKDGTTNFAMVSIIFI